MSVPWHIFVALVLYLGFLALYISTMRRGRLTEALITKYNQDSAHKDDDHSYWYKVSHDDDNDYVYDYAY